MKVRRDMKDMKIQPKLWPIIQERAKKAKKLSTYLPPACYTLSKVEKQILLECLNGIKVHTGYSSNI